MHNLAGQSPSGQVAAPPRGAQRRTKTTTQGENFAQLPLDIPQRTRYILFPGGTLSPRHLVHFFPVFSIVRGKSPIFIIDGNRPGVGKNLLASLTGTINDGIEPAITPQCGNEEMRKRITSLLLAGIRTTIVDNFKGHLSSTQVEAFATCRYWLDRELGTNEVKPLPNDLMFIYTANGMTVSLDTAKRSIFIHLAYFDEDLASRKFRHKDLSAHASEDRQRYYSALMSIIRAWFEEGCPEGEVPLPSFDAWARTVGGILMVAEVHGFLSNRKENLVAADPETADIGALVDIWLAKSNGALMTVGESLKLAEEYDLFAWIFSREGTDKSRQTAFGKLLARYKGRIVHGHRIIRPNEKRRPAEYMLSKDEGI